MLPCIRCSPGTVRDDARERLAPARRSFTSMGLLHVDPFLRRLNTAVDVQF